MKYFILFSTLILFSFTSFISTQYSGDLDLSFGSCGKVTTDILGYINIVNSMVLQDDGKIILTGYGYFYIRQISFVCII
jgi:hypothetical protein